MSHPHHHMSPLSTTKPAESAVGGSGVLRARSHSVGGGEGGGIGGEEVHPAIADAHGHGHHDKQGFDQFTAVCFTLNYIVGTGFLVLPWAFVRAGLLLSAVAMLSASAVADLCAHYVLEAMARAEALLDEDEAEAGGEVDGVGDDGGTVPLVGGDECDDLVFRRSCSSGGAEKLLPGAGSSRLGDTMPRLGSHIEGDPSMRLLSDGISGRGNERPSDYRSFSSAHSGGATTMHPLLLVRGRHRLETTTLCELFLHPRWGPASYAFFVATYLYFCLWVYASVFALAVATLGVPLPPFVGEDHYPVYVLLFGAIVIPMTQRDLEDQRLVQVCLTVCRVARLFLMIGTSLLASATSFRAGGGGGGAGNGGRGLAADFVAAPWVRWDGFFDMVPVVVVATIFHMAVPDLSYPVLDKTKLGTVFRWALGITGLVYSALGVSAGWRFGYDANQSSNLNWTTFRGPADDDERWWPRWAYVGVSYFVVCSPALDVVSGFPLNALTLANNLAGLYLGGTSSSHHHGNEQSRQIRRVSRLLASVPPIIGALFVRDLGVVTQYAGVSGLAIMFCFPSILFLRSGELARRRGLSVVDTAYRSYGSSELWARAIFGLGVAMMVMVFALLVLGK